MKRFLLFMTLPIAAATTQPTYAQFGRRNAPTPVPVPIPATTRPAIQTPSQANASLPLRQVVLFSSGVGYFSRAGMVRDNAVVDLTVRAPQLSDILKSLVLFDATGNIAPVSYSISDYLATQARETDINVATNATPGDVLKAFQGAQVRLQKDSGTLEGRIVSVSTRQIRVGDTTNTVEVVTLLQTAGLQSVRLDDVTAITLLDPALDAKLRASLEKTALRLTTQLDDGMRRITLRFNGKGERNARAGYLLEMPSWKTSYRLVLDGKNKPYLQGWAIVENPTDDDWRDAQISLVSGRPVSFIQNLAAPLYITRPVVASPIPNGSLTPQTFGEGFDEDEKARNAASGAVALGGGVGGFGGAGGRAGRLMAPTSPPALASRAAGIFSNSGSFSRDDLRDAAQEIAAGQQVLPAQAQGAEKGDLFVYAVDAKLTLPRGEAAMVPIVSKDIEGDAVTIVQSNGRVEALAPTNGFRLRNTTAQHLQGGPMTVYSEGVYAGDALITNVSPGESKLIAYALDLDLAARLDRVDEDQNVVAVKSVGGALLIARKATKTQVYLLRNKDDKPKNVLIQQPAEAGWNLSDPKQLAEKSNDGLRFKVTVPANASLEYKIEFEQPRQETVAVTDFDFDLLDFYLTRKVISPELKTALEAIAVKKQRLSELSANRVAQEKALKAITTDQERIRSNMNSLSRESALYKNYESKLTAQETQIEKLVVDIDRLQTAEASARRDLDVTIQNLKVA